MNHPRASVLIALSALLAVFWLSPSFPLVAFVAVLIAVALRAVADPLAARLPIPEAATVVLVVLAGLGLLGLGARLAVGPLTEQASQLRDVLPTSFAGLEARLETRGWGQWLLDRFEPAWLENLEAREVLRQGGTVAGVAAQAAGGLFGGLGSALFTFLMAIYFALHPTTYLNGLACLFSPALRGEIDELLSETGTTLRYWLAGQLFSMCFIGLFVWLGLWLLGVPLAPLLAVLSALLGFIPIVGPIVAAVPAVLIAASQGLDTAVYAVALYLALHLIEGDILTPMIQSRAVNLPPGLLLMAQLLMGAVFGLLGIAVAAPLAAVTLVAVRRGYVGHWLRGPGTAAGRPPVPPAVPVAPPAPDRAPAPHP